MQLFFVVGAAGGQNDAKVALDKCGEHKMAWKGTSTEMDSQLLGSQGRIFTQDDKIGKVNRANFTT